MATEKREVPVHPTGDPNAVPDEAGKPHAVDTFGGRVQVHWDPSAEVTAYGPVTYFIEFLKTSGLWERWVADCPLNYTSRNAPKKEEILATILLSVLAGHRRYAHITSIRSDSVLPRLLGVDCLRSEDAVRRAFQQGQEQDYTLWLDLHLNATFEPLLEQEWILDIDSTVKTLYGKQQEARVGYNPTKPGRPSHCYHAYFIAELRMVLNVDVHAGNQTASAYAQPGLWSWLDAREKKQWPSLLRGDVSWGTEETMREAEQRGMAYLFKLRQTLGVQKHLARLMKRGDWQRAGGGWYGRESRLRLQGWTKARRVIVLRRQVREALAVTGIDEETGQTILEGMAAAKKGRDLYEYAVLVTSWPEQDMLAIAQMYRDRADAENVFDELKNQWGWTGFTTQDVRRSQMMARIIALVFNWWSLYTRLAIPGRHTEALTSRPLLLQGIARKTTHSQRQRLTITSAHGKAGAVQRRLKQVSEYLQQFRQAAEQLTQPERWGLLLRAIFREYYQPTNASQTLPAPA
jgi:hypothetical protein